MLTWFFILLSLAGFACAIVAGVFLTFSDFVMRSLHLANTSAGVEVMQLINREVYKSVFMLLLLGIAALAPVMIGYAFWILTGLAQTLTIGGGFVYLAGVFGVTAIFNVPMNNVLDTLEFSSTEAATYWKMKYVPNWTFWNTTRTIAAALSAGLYLAACVAILMQGPTI